MTLTIAYFYSLTIGCYVIAIGYNAIEHRLFLFLNHRLLCHWPLVVMPLSIGYYAIYDRLVPSKTSRPK